MAQNDLSVPERADLLVLSPFRLPAQSALYLGDDDVRCLLNAYTLLWHPALLSLAAGVPRIASPYDHEQPSAGQIFAVPEHPPLVLPEDWDYRVQQADALAFRAGPERQPSLLDLVEHLSAKLDKWLAHDLAPEQRERSECARQLLELPAAQLTPFFGLGLGYAHIEALFEAMEHQAQLDAAGLWEDVQAAVQRLREQPSPERDLAVEEHLRSAAQRLQSAREVLFPSAIYLIEFRLLTDENLEGVASLLEGDLPVNVITPASRLQRLGQRLPERLARLRERCQMGTAEVCGGGQVEREDPLLPLESQLWNLQKGLAVSEELLGQRLRVFARARFGFLPQTPALLQMAGLSRALFFGIDDGVFPTHRSTVVSWPAPDGKQIDAFCRAPRSANNPQTYLHLAHYLHESMVQDHVATLAILHSGECCAWLDDWQALSRLAPVLGQWVTISRYLDEVTAGDYASASSADEFHSDYLSERTADVDSPDAASYGYNSEKKPRVYRPTEVARTHPVSAFAAHARLRRQVDSAWTFLALQRSLSGKSQPLPLEDALRSLEDRLEEGAPESATDAGLQSQLAQALQQAASALADRLLARAEKATPGYLVLNPCSFARRVVLELPDVTVPVPVEGPVKACQLQDNQARLIVEVPALGFAWFPRKEGKLVTPKMRLADDRCVRNEFFEAEIDPKTGGLRGLREHKTRISRIGQQLVFNPGSQVRVKEIKTTSTGPALGEIVTEGELLDEHERVLARFQQRFRAWVGRPVLDLQIEITPEHPPAGYPWHAYYGARFAWRDERETLLRGVNGLGYVTAGTRPETPDYLELRAGQNNVVLLTGGLPFHQRHGARMLDVILIPEGEQATRFDLALGLDRESPMLTAFGMVSPVAVVPTTKGPPHVGASGWLFHLDATHLMMTSMRPLIAGGDGVLARLLEVGNYYGNAELRCVRNPVRARQTDLALNTLMENGFTGDSIFVDVSQNEWLQLQMEFSLEGPALSEQPLE